MDCVTARDSSYDLLPPQWARWSDAYKTGMGPSVLGLACEQAALNRFAARFRVAKAFDGVALTGLGMDTADGYSALFRLFLAWSAFEQYLKAIPCTQQQCLNWFQHHVPDDAVEKIRSLDAGNRFFGLIRAKTRRDAHVEVSKYLSRDEFNFTYLAASARHIFVHGLLTPHANGASPQAVAKICNMLASIHLAAAGADFGGRVTRAL